MVCESHLAEDVTQSVFVALAKNAAQLTNCAVLSGWLHRTAQNIAAQTVRTEVRRRAREQEAATMNELCSTESDSTWQHISPHLDAALGELEEIDRDALLLRYFEKKSALEMAGILGISDEAAQKRVSRAVERIRELFARRGVTVGAAGLGVISANAVQAAPAGFAATISNAVIAGTGISVSTVVATTAKTIAMTTAQKILVAATLAVVAGAGLYEARQTAQLRAQVQTLNEQQASLLEKNAQALRERDEALKRRASGVPALRLPAPALPAVAATPSAPLVSSATSNNMMRLLNGESPKLTAQQIAAYLKENRRNAASLLAVFRVTGDKAFLNEALERFPNDPQVAFDGVFNSESPEQRRQRLQDFERAAPDNAMANYLSAFDCFKSGRNDLAIKELEAAYAKPQFQDYSWDFIQSSEEAWRSAGYSEADVKMLATWQLALPQASQLDQLHKSIMDLATAYQQAGDSASAQMALQFNLRLGQQMDGSPNDVLVNQLIGLAIQRDALGAMPPNDPYGTAGLTVSQQIEQLNQQSAAIKSLVKQTAPLQAAMTPQDWITYNDRTIAFGELNALQWLIAKYPQQ